jgi:hypothetical protein
MDFSSCVQGSPCLAVAQGIPTALVALVIGGLTVYIAWKQKDIARAKLKLDLFERRYKIFEQVWTTVSDTFSYGPRDERFGQVGLGRLGTPFNFYIPEAGFLFGKKIETYIHELAKKWAQFHHIEGLPKELSTPEQLSAAIDLQNYFKDQLNQGIKAMFSPYLDFDKWKS